MVAGKACDGVWGYPPQGDALKKKGSVEHPQPERWLCVPPHGIPPQGDALMKKGVWGIPQREMKSRSTSLSTSHSTSSKKPFPKSVF